MSSYKIMTILLPKNSASLWYNKNLSNIAIIEDYKTTIESIKEFHIFRKDVYHKVKDYYAET